MPACSGSSTPTRAPSTATTRPTARSPRARSGRRSEPWSCARAGGIAAAVRDGIGLVDESTGALDLIAPIELDAPGNRMNDAKCDPAGRLWAGTMALDLTPGAGSLYRILPDHSFTRVVGESRAPTASAGAPRAIACTTSTRSRAASTSSTSRSRPARSRIAGGSRASRRDEFRTAWPSTARGTSGSRSSATAASGGTRRTGARRPARAAGRQPTSVAFGGDDLGDLYITTATIRFGAEQLPDHPDAGATFVCRPGVTGTPVHAFGG